MSKNVIIVVVLLLLIVAAAFFFMGRSDDAPATSESESMTADTVAQTTPAEQTGDRGVRSFIELIGLGQAMTCTYSTDALDSPYPTNGTMHTDGTRVRVDSVSVVENEEVQFSMIDDGTNTYTWGTNAEGTFAMKMPRVDITEQSQNEATQNEQFDYNQDVEYDCTPGGIDSSKFVPPSDIEFMDLEAMQSGSMDAATMQRMMEQYGADQ